MKIVYSVVARGKTVLAENTARNANGNFITITRMLLGKIQPNNNTKLSVMCQQHVFHYIVEGGVTYMCMAEEAAKRRIPFAFLNEIKTRFTSAYKMSDISKAIAFGMNSEFGKVLAQQMAYFNDNPDADNFGKLRGQIGEVKDIMMENIEKVLERGEKVELLVDKTEALSQQANKFKKTTKQVRNAMWWKNCRMKLILAFALIVVLYFILALACGGPGLGSCF